MHLTEYFGLLYLAHGVTTLREAGDICVKVYDGLDEPRVHALVEAADAAGLVAIGQVPFGLTVEQARVRDTQHLMGTALPADIRAGDHVVSNHGLARAVDEARIDAVVRECVALGLAHTPTLESSRASRCGAPGTRAPSSTSSPAWWQRNG